MHSKGKVTDYFTGHRHTDRPFTVEDHLISHNSGGLIRVDKFSSDQKCKRSRYDYFSLSSYTNENSSLFNPGIRACLCCTQWTVVYRKAQRAT